MLERIFESFSRAGNEVERTPTNCADRPEKRTVDIRGSSGGYKHTLASEKDFLGTIHLWTPQQDASALLIFAKKYSGREEVTRLLEEAASLLSKTEKR